jgi:hypothetical protein
MKGATDSADGQKELCRATVTVEVIHIHEGHELTGPNSLGKSCVIGNVLVTEFLRPSRKNRLELSVVRKIETRTEYRCEGKDLNNRSVARAN